MYGIGNRGMKWYDDEIETEPRYQPASGLVQNRSPGECRLHTDPVLSDEETSQCSAENCLLVTH